MCLFEFLVFGVVEASDFVRSGSVWVVPNVIVDGPEAIQSILDLHRNTVVRDCAFTRLLVIGNRH